MSIASIADNLIAIKILYKLVTPFDETDAHSLGVIDADGNPQLKIRDMDSKQKDAYTTLDRLVFSLKRLLAKIPGGSSRIASLSAAYYLIKEAHENKTSITESKVRHVYDNIDAVHLIEETLIVEKFIKDEYVEEDAPANAVGTGAAVSTNIELPLNYKKKKDGSVEIARRKTKPAKTGE